jgi:F0F1-type ATP synthase assembly protein I
MADKKEGPLSEGVERSAWFLALTGGMELAVSVLGGVWLGLWADKKWNSSPWFLLCGALGGMTLGLYQIVRISKNKK